MNSAVIDANIAIYAVIPTASHQRVIGLLERLVTEEVPIYVPHLWLSEVATGIRKTAVLTGLSAENAILALKAALDLPVEIISENADLCVQAYAWAGRIGHLAVYDSIYLALAEHLDAVLYTADKKLFNRCREIGADFVKLPE